MGPRTLRTDTACIALLAIARSSRESSGFRVQIDVRGCCNLKSQP
jgi:Fe-S cluster assembly iron-binding protein IscA